MLQIISGRRKELPEWFSATRTFGFAMALRVGAESKAVAAITCTDADSNGHYAFSSVGQLLNLPPEGAGLPGAIAQSRRFDPVGHGHVPIETNASDNGIVLNGSTPGAKYSVSPDCVITSHLTLIFPLSAPSSFQGILSEGDQRMALDAYQGTYEVSSECFVTLNYQSGSGASARQITIDRP